MPPKPAAKTAAKTTGTKTTTTKTGAKAAPAKTGGAKGATKGATGTKGEPAKPAEAAKPIVVPVNPKDISLKQIAAVYQCNEGDEVGKAYKESGKNLFILDKEGQSATFLKYRNANMLVATTMNDVQEETIRMAILGSLRFGKPLVLDISNTDNEKMMSSFSDTMDKIYEGLMKDILSKKIKEGDFYMKMVRKTDGPEYQNEFEYMNLEEFQMIVISNADPPSTLLHDYFVIRVV